MRHFVFVVRYFVFAVTVVGHHNFVYFNLFKIIFTGSDKITCTDSPSPWGIGQVFERQKAQNLHGTKFAHELQVKCSSVQNFFRTPGCKRGFIFIWLSIRLIDFRNSSPLRVV